ncbi:C40 family peptidase [Maribacter sp. 2307ULW6-5]|uniref:C40 family peptidase n=1 Tax=Maribacter sp. 2307ULW6-5 TaxID=3386275 RepID=UPI0039BD893C
MSPRTVSLFTLFLFLVGCNALKKGKTAKENRTVSVAAAHEARTGERPTAVAGNSGDTALPLAGSKKAEDIINTALTFSGVRYKFGGTTKKGMDCSGLLYVSFAKHDVPLPRTSFHMASKGQKIRLGNVAKGDLLFFKTTKRAKRINHVGMVVDVDGKDIKFIHASTSRGVIVSSLREGYWNSAFVKATRVL